MVGKDVWIRARVHMVTGKGKIVFLILRQQFNTIQATTSVSETISQGMVKYLLKQNKESIVDCFATITAADVQKTSQKQELHIKEFWCVNKSVPKLPFELDNASVRCEDQTLEGKGSGDAEEEENKGEVVAEAGKEEGKEENKDEKARAVVKQKVRLDNRIIDLRIPTN
jgi:aspartyl/asparaginyl-tRNA synthetase